MNGVNYELDYGVIVPPRITLLELLEDRKMSVSDLATKMELPAAIVETLIKGSLPISPDIAAKLSLAFPNISAQFWLNLLSEYDREILEYQASYNKTAKKAIPQRPHKAVALN